MRPPLTVSRSASPWSFLNALTTFVAPRDAGHAHEDVVQLGAVRGLLERLLDEGVLHDLVLDASLAELGAERGRLLDGHPLVIEEDRGGHLVELALHGPDHGVLAS